ncbi:GNAT family N-acetyltransferase [Candidatus Methylospira mobilis]|uniref:GNAT family N-acetyltransferase n=1 Tax=Candidatus Methylospira mobilis TaxID=1808979 RepID=A0A5Q0BCX5_9GAMM|nr:GNAT family N-acetyltransferase [Candidatus Methylospira mobilis]QFY41660.1 GNAT family N-acetyltransferase [Candidatus Methylospira mobilis]WNV05087.1 GNAT family N-acetyltransferase [Candidatus Methylospira mobilis]
MNEPLPLDPGRFQPLTLLPMNPARAALFGANLAGIDPWLRLGYSPAGLARYLSANAQGRQALAVLDGETPAACFSVRPGWLRGPLLELLAVLPQHQGRGLGKKIIRGLADESRCQGQANLWTISSEFNISARGFYHSLGFEENGVLPDLVRLGETEILLRLKLQVV